MGTKAVEEISEDCDNFVRGELVEDNNFRAVCKLNDDTYVKADEASV